ncbi:hypothetical protein LPJ81_001296, partial [Coemansia sp. IMI 209127]
KHIHDVRTQRQHQGIRSLWHGRAAGRRHLTLLPMRRLWVHGHRHCRVCRAQGDPLQVL